jgi:hypothetical protein
MLAVAEQRADARTAANRVAWERAPKRQPLKDACSPPTYVDKNGIRRAKPECF